MYAGGQSRGNGGGGDGGRDALLRRRRQPGLSSSPVATASCSSSPGRAEEVEEEGGGKKQGRRKRQGKREAVARAIRDGLPAAAASCWRGVTVIEEGRRGRTRRRDDAADDGSARGGDASGEGGSGPGAAAWCCVCPDGDECSLEPNPSANGKEDPGVRSLLERNDFFAADCNPHVDGLRSSSSSSW